MISLLFGKQKPGNDLLDPDRSGFGIRVNVHGDITEGEVVPYRGIEMVIVRLATLDPPF